MAETVNIGEIADRLSEDLFKPFRWSLHPLKNDNFACTNPSHVKKQNGKTAADGTEIKPKQKDLHPGDAVFHYLDPYLRKRVYLHTDLKSYAKSTLTTQKLRSAIESLAMTVDCARNSNNWRQKYSVLTDEDIEVRGLLFVHNHDGNYVDDFDNGINKTNLSTIPIAPNVYIHFLGPHDINRLYTISNDLIRLQHQNTLPKEYSFYYPDLVMWRLAGNVYSQPATIEALTAPYSIITYQNGDKSPAGFLIYYNRSGSSVEEFEYFIDSLSRYQMLEPGKLIRVRIVCKSPHSNLLSNFNAAVTRYAKAWGFDTSRTAVLDAIRVEEVNAVMANYSAGFIGWRPEP